jgi:hypothetical protein
MNDQRHVGGAPEAAQPIDIDAVREQAEANKRTKRFKANPKHSFRAPGRTSRPKRDRIQINARVQHYRRCARAKGKPINEMRFRRAASAWWEITKARVTLPHRSRRQAEGSPRPKVATDHPLIMQAAKVRSSAGQEIRRRLRDYDPGDGRPANRDLAAAIVERNLYEDLAVQFRRPFLDFTAEARPLLEYAYDEPYFDEEDAAKAPEDDDRRPQGISENNVSGLINGRPKYNKDGIRIPGAYQPGMLNDIDPDFLLDLGVDAWLETGRLYEQRNPRWGRNWGVVMSVDGTRLPLAAEQRQSFSVEDDLELNGRFTLDEVAYGYHGPGTGWRGHNGMFLSDALGPMLAPVMKLIPANENEAPFVPALLDSFYDRVGADWTRTRFLLGDREFFHQDLCESLAFRYGLIPLFPWNASEAGKLTPWTSNRGVPYCECTGRRVDMRYLEGTWFGPKDRHRLGLVPGQDIRDVLPTRDWPRVRYECEHCPNSETLWVHKAAHINTWAPLKDVHRHGRPDRYRLRWDYLSRRGASESLNNSLKYRCFGIGGPIAARCVKTQRQMLWYAYGRNLSMILERLAYADGSYMRVRDAVIAQGLHKPGLLRRMRDAGMAGHDPLADSLVPGEDTAA